ncbi:hypothetical protein [Spirosoma soli]|uniref:hypothetical protein n=1 Tax=Spirosoma soli TaxID=1770529 RepID=UPI0036D30947
MTRKLRPILLGILWVCLLSCQPKEEPLPVSVWSQACVELAPYQQGYRLSGICCEYIILPQLRLDRNKQFSVKAEYFTFTGAGFAGRPISVNGNLSANGQVLTISYSTGATVTTHELKPGAATAFCYCGCD